MSNGYPNAEELPKITTALEQAGADMTKALPHAIKAFAAGTFTTDTVKSYAVLLKDEHPELWPLSPEEAEQRETDERVQGLIAEIISNPRSPNARGALVRAVGKAKADDYARGIGLRGGIGDFTSRPSKADTKEPSSGKPDDSKTNPWSRAGWSITRQGQLVRAAGLVNAQKMAAAAGSFIGATRPPSQ